MARKKDITETGPKALRGIRNPDLYSVSKDNPVDATLSDLDREMLKNDLGKAAYRNYDVSTGHVGYSALQDPSLFEPQVTPLDYGSSKYDTGLLLNPDQGDIQDQRANSQSGFLKVVNGLAKGAVLAGTTFLDGTVGLVYGIGSAANQKRWSALWDNDFSRAMQKINDVSEELMPNYYTQDEQQNPWDHIFSANFIGDKFIKNLGFTVGALYSGGVISGGVRGIGAAISTAKAFTKATAHVATGVGVFTSALNEGRIEAINNSRDWFNLHAMKLEDGYKQRIAALREEYEANAGKNLVGDAEHGYVDPAYIKYQEGLRKEEKAYRAALTELNEKKLHMGNVDLLMNLPILMASNFVQFARFYANGFNTGRKVFNVLGDPGKYVAGTGKKRLAVELGKRGLAEGTEEISQRAASEISGDYYSTDVMNFYKSKTNREAEMETLDFMKSFATGINKTVNDGSAWEEFLIGALTGIMGVPKFRSMHNAQGKLQSPVTLYNEGWEKWKENKEIRAKEAELVDALNTRFNSEDFLNYYQGLIRNKKFQIDMNRAIEEGDEFGFKNAEHAQLISDIIMFDKAGKLNDLKAAMGIVNDVSDENLESIIKNTTTKDDGGKLVGPFAQYAAIDKETNEIVANFGSEQDKKDMATKLKENNKTITNTIEEYQKRKGKFVTRYGDKFTDDQLSELTWMNLQLDNWAKRSEEMAPAIKDELKHILGSLNKANRLNQELRDSEGREHADLTDLYRIFDRDFRNLSNLIQRVKSYTNLNDTALARILTSNPKIAENFIKLIEGESDSVDKDDIISKLRDMVKIGKAADTYAAKLAEYLKIPEKLTEDEKKADDETVKQATAEAITNAKDTLSKATTSKEFRDTADTLKRENPEESDNINQAIQNLANEGNQQAKAYQDISQYIVDVNAALTTANLSPQTLSDASNILNTLASDSNSLEELMNPEAVVDDEMFLEEGVNSLEDAKNRNVAAQYALSKAKEKVNNGNKFKDRFSAAYQTPTDNKSGTGTGVDEETTGDSGTPTIPDTGNTTAPTSTEGAPVGDSSIDDIKKDNKELNDSVEDPVPPKRGEVKQYYRPAVPELHIEASRKGDFRPFVDVVREREGADFSAIYNYLVKNDVFKYLNEGNLHEGDELGFMIDPEFEREVEGKEWHKKPTIFIINKRDGHIVGSLDESEGSIKKFEGLKELEDRIITEYNSNQPSSSTSINKFTATPTTKVSQIMVGKVPYSEDERNLNDVLETYMQSGKEVFFGVIKNGVLNTNGKVDPSAVMPLKDTSNKKGRLYLLVPNGANKYSPVAVRVKHFNAEEFNPADVNLQDNTTMRNIKNAIKALSEVTSKEELDVAVPTLAKVLYKGNLHIDFVDSAYGTGIRFTKIFRDSDGKEIYEEDSGNRKRKEEVITVDLTKKGNTIAVLGDDNQFHDVEPTQVPQEQVIKEITDTLLSFNLPIQISISDINTSSRYQGNVTRYNNGIIEAGLLTSNLTEMGTKSTWFTTDYFDAQGNPHKAINPVYKASPSAATPSQGAINGVQITSASDDKIYFVDLQTNTIRDSEGKVIPTTDANSVLIDVAWAQKMYGDATEGVNMFNNKVITPSGKALDRTTQKYLDDRELQLLKQDIANMQNRTELVEKANKILEKINEDQSKVDKTRTDQEYYYILEDDGQYHQYERVHKALGPNWIGESTSNANSSRALVAGSAVDSVIRQYFMTDNPSTIQRPDKLTKGAFSQLLDALSKIKARMEANGERFLTNNIVLYYKYSDGRRVAGEVDILAINKNGRYSIYDVKTSARSFSHQYFTEKGPKQVVSTKDYYTLQLSAYQNLFESKYDSDIRELGIVPFVLGYYQNTDVVNTVVNEPDIPITYNPNVNVPLVDTTRHNRSEDEVSTQNTPNNAQAAINALNLDNEDDEDDDILRLRETTDSSYEVWDKEQELAWLEKVLPQLSKEDRLQFVKGLIKVGNNGVYAWGKLDKGIVTLSDIAAKGTIYHEAFHVVFNYLLDPNDRDTLLAEYSEKMPNADNIDLEEALAEDFREFVMQGGRDTRSLGRKIIDFFKSLFIKTKYWKDFRPSSIYYFKRINDSRYANGKFGINKNTRAMKVEYTQEMKDILAKAPRDSEGNLLAPNNNRSNLDERQYAQVRTKAFKGWFGDWENDPDNASKVRDENGEPLVVYHGSREKDFYTFDISKNDKGQKGFFFTNSKNMAKSYGDIRGFFINSRDPYIVEGNNSNWNELNIKTTTIAKNKIDAIRLHRNDLMLSLKEKEVSEDVYNFWYNKYYKYLDAYNDLTDSIKDKIKKVYLLAKLNNFQGEGGFIKSTRYTEKILELETDDVNIIFNNIKDYGPVFNIDSVKDLSNDKANNVYVVTNPNNIKSATDNIGTFSTTNDDIRYKKVPEGNRFFSTLDSYTKDNLIKRGWTEEMFNSVSQIERDHLLKCS